MPNHYLTVCLCGRDYKAMQRKGIEEYEQIDLSVLHGVDLCDKVNPMPSDLDGDSACEWGVNQWGTKWGAYRTKVTMLGGDGSPVLISFESAWSHPNNKTLSAIEQYLNQEFFLYEFTWIGHDPYDNSTKVIRTTERV